MELIRIGIFGLRRGANYIDHFLNNNAAIVAVCDSDPFYLNRAGEKLGRETAQYQDFDSFIQHPMDAVFLANCFHEHTPYAIRCLEMGIHVLSECTAGSTMAECVALVRAAEKSNAIYMLAENYPYMLINREMKRVYDSGDLGPVMYAEGEYNHPGLRSWRKEILKWFSNEKHWRYYHPRTYYITHSLAPIMYATGALPTSVQATAVFRPDEATSVHPDYVGDKAAIITTKNDDGSVFTVTGCAAFGGDEVNSYRICGEKGMIENVRGGGKLMALNFNRWQIPEGKKQNNLYEAQEYDKDADAIAQAGHDGSDYLVARVFLDAIRSGETPDFDVYFATRLSAVAIQAHRSILNNGATFPIPDFKNEEDRKQYENDTDSPFWYSDGTAPTMPCCSVPDYEPFPEQLENYRSAAEEHIAERAGK